MTHARSIIAVDNLRPMHDSPIRVAGAAIPPGDWKRHDPFLSLMNDRFKPGAFGLHPHRGFETITYVLDGALAHEDTRGGSGTLGVGDAQWMTAGRGVEHNEHPIDQRFVHVLQLWLNLPARDKMVPSRYQDLRGADMPVRREPGIEARVFSGRSGDVIGPALNYTPVTMVDVRMEPGARFVQQLPGDYNGFIHVISGSGRFGRDAVEGAATQTLWLEHAQSGSDSEIAIEAMEPLHVILLAGQPLQEPVVAHGPFVMNTQAQIAEAIADFNRGGFGQS